MHRQQPPPSVAELAPDVAISPPLEAVIERALTKDRDERFATAESFRQALGDTPEAAGGADAGPESESAGKTSAGGEAAPRRRMGRASPLILLGVAAAAAVLWALVF